MNPWERRSPDRPDGGIRKSQSGDWRSRERAYSEHFQSREWFSRGYLPHRDSSDLIQHVTFHLADSLPKSAIDRIDQSLIGIPDDQRKTERRKQLDAWMDAGHGACLLENPEIAELVQNSLLHFNDERYRLHEWVVMPNHVHVLFQPINGWSLAKIVASWKKFTARRIKDLISGTANLPIGPSPTELDNSKPRSTDRTANLPIGPSPIDRENGKPRSTDRVASREIGRPGAGPVWHREYWDRYIRNQSHYDRVVEYIHHNPVAVGLVDSPEAWPWSSAKSVFNEVEA